MPEIKNGNAKKRGRPATGRDPQIVVRLPKRFAEAIDTWASGYEGLGRSAAIRSLIAIGLRTAEKGKRASVLAVEDPADNWIYRDYNDPKRDIWRKPKRYARKPKPPKLPPMEMPEPDGEPEKPNTYKPPHPARTPTRAHVEAAVERAVARSEARKPNGGGA
jgi:hypothetical protein